MRSAAVLALEAGPFRGPDLTRYLLVCLGLIAGLFALAWLFRRHVAGHLRARAARRSLQILDVLPLSGRQKLVVVRCYDRSFLLGVGEKEVRGIAELDGAAAPSSSAASAVSAPPRPPSFPGLLEHELVLQPTPPRVPAPDPKGGVLA